MESYNKFKMKIIKNHIVFSIIVLSLFYALKLTNEANGYILGAIVSMANFIILGKINEKLLTLGEDKFQSYSKKWFFFRYLLFALALIGSFKKDYFSLSGTVIGLISLQISIFFSMILGKLRE